MKPTEKTVDSKLQNSDEAKRLMGAKTEVP